jgi:hypothetical protein
VKSQELRLGEIGECSQLSAVLEWLPAFARWIDAPEPPRMSVADAFAVAGAEAVYYHMSLTGASNAGAKASLVSRRAATLGKQRALIERTNRK